jgi:hypothetical protein
MLGQDLESGRTVEDWWGPIGDPIAISMAAIMLFEQSF